MKKVLIASLTLPYANVPHAGGKTHYYYLQKLLSSSSLEVNLISFCRPEEKEKNDLKGANTNIICLEDNIFSRALRFLCNFKSRFNFFDSKGNFSPGIYKFHIKRYLKQLKSKNYMPDIIIMEWTQIVLLSELFSEYFPDAKLVASEHDVSFLLFQRKLFIEKGAIQKYINKIRYNNLKNAELYNLKHCDLIITHNEKDKQLLCENNIDIAKIFTIVPYFKDYSYLKWHHSKNRIIFYGAMGRPENYLSAIWFIENVFNDLQIDDLQLCVVGNNPPKQLLQYARNNIIITGYQEKIDDFLSDCLCMVAPLILGAGIKVKILEALSAGVPVLTNSIGIEGIPVYSGIEYIHCESDEEYKSIISNIINDEDRLNKISLNAQKFMKENYNLSESINKYYNAIMKL
ncbi:glycosyltransferase family 4 protein [Enterocloster aldenensis]|uniref:glycosyltransferase family 4 protein n=1 Tax=Enterocloster aldenensis TaxID=358742 RepID=UPI001D097715|nr:glycosyltransferase family 4 protein [Enterocloster aldenensis]